MNTDRNIKTPLNASRMNNDQQQEEDQTITEDVVFKCAMTKDYKNIVDLNIVKEGITYIESGNLILRQMTNLKRLDLSFNSLTRLDNLDCLKDLRELNVSYNRLDCIDNLTKCINLKTLILDHNRIKKLENLKQLRKLEVL